MIKIPTYKYNRLDVFYLDHIKDYVQDAIQFYVNCCEIKLGNISANSYKDNITTYHHSKSLFSLIHVICEPFNLCSNKIKVNHSHSSVPVVKMIPELFSKGLIRKEFSGMAPLYLNILKDMLEPTTEIYFENILTSIPENLFNLYDHICNTYSGIIDDSGRPVFRQDGIAKGLFHSILSRIFNYDKFSVEGFKCSGSNQKWGAYDLCKKLNINVCPYCNRMFTFTVYSHLGKALTRPELDHYLPQSKFPIFSLSFYNLIPSCKVCNSSFKRDVTMNIRDYLHPYIDGVHSKYSFDYEPIEINAFNGDKEKVKIMINRNGYSDPRSENTINLFKIEDIYRMHNDIVAELIIRRQRYSDTKIKEIAELFNTGETPLYFTIDEIFNSIFDVPVKSDLIDSSLGKLRNDISDKLRILV